MNFKCGDIVEISLPEGKKIVGKILYLSDYFRDVIGAVFPIDGGPFEVQYTNLKAAKHYGWKVIENHDLTPDDLEKTRRIVGGEVFIGDKMIRSATDDDRKFLPKMLVKGMPVILDELQQFGV